ncbi:hypothetical protein LJC04_04360, partial [Ruminococcaceae bacterium OttesenSCG-928-O06]|nr:hypothetical protein [Ruminococcaceae bacterium OttesenSCG-928-O06]
SFSQTIGAYAESNVEGEYTVSLNYQDIENIAFVASCLGDRPGYYNIPRRYQEVYDFLVINHPLFTLANKIRILLEKFGTPPGVFYAWPVERGRAVVNDFRKLHQLKANEIYKGALSAGDVPVKWKSEYSLYRAIKQVIPNAVFQHMPDWLKPQSIDIYIPDQEIAIEYQGQQHFQPVEYFGGEEAYTKTVERDSLKAEKCKDMGVTLLYWKYDTPVTQENVESFLNSNLNRDVIL